MNVITQYTLSPEESKKLREKYKYCTDGYHYLGPNQPAYNPSMFSLSDIAPDES